jgi:hypothetical protein
MGMLAHDLSLATVRMTNDDAIVLGSLCLVQYSPHMKSMHITDGDSNYEVKCLMLRHLSQCCPEVEEMGIRSVCAATIFQAIGSFPKIAKIKCESFGQNPRMSSLDDTVSFPQVETFQWYSVGEHETAVPLIKACSNLRSLSCEGFSMHICLPEVLVSCDKLTSLKLIGECGTVDSDISWVISAIADFGLQLEELFLILSDATIDISNYSMARDDMIIVIKRLKSFKLNIEECFIEDHDDPESSLCSIFISPEVDLRTLRLNTDDESADMIAMMVQGCRRIEKLELSGTADMRSVLMNISASCHQLVDLVLDYQGIVTGPAMKALSQSCPQLKSLNFQAALDAEAYENLALYGGNIIELNLGRRYDRTTRTARSFAASSPLNEPSFK